MVQKSSAATIQCSTGPFWAFELEHALDALAEAGFVEIELMVTRDPRTHEPELPARLAEERGLTIASVHGPFLVVTKSVWGMDPIEKIRRGVEMCTAFGARSLIVHPPYLWEAAYARWIIEESAAYSQEHGVAVAVETMYPRWVAGRRLRGHRWLRPQELVDYCPHVALDTSHVTVAREDVLDSYTTLAPRLTHIHLSDNAGNGRDGHLELEQGVLPLERFLAELRRTQYSGVVSLELSVNRYLERPKELTEMLIKNRKYVEDRLTREIRTVKGLPRSP
ncbi:MAG: sugar phosphate isomerase/epimerase [Actinomycetota bacterium]|nr:sugar phosphate isomerase/epimerase [Actinomycetota bacterium]